jgi:hypothetical protein
MPLRAANQIALLFCGTIAAGIAYKNGMPWDGIRQEVVDGIAIGLPAIMILLAVGALIGTWSARPKEHVGSDAVASDKVRLSRPVMPWYPLLTHSGPAVRRYAGSE